MILIKKFLHNIIFGFTKSKNINNKKFILTSKITKAFRPFLNNDFDPIEVESIKKYGNDGDVFIDIGANIGIMSCEMSELAGEKGVVYSVEPNPFIFSDLVSIISKNTLFSNVVPIQAALGDHLHMIDFYISNSDLLGVMSSSAMNDKNSVKINVPQLTLDFLTKDFTKLNYLKIDAEGSEVLILKGGMESLKKFNPIVQIEVHGNYLPNFNSTVNDLFEIMEELNYTAFNLLTGLEVSLLEFNENTHFHVIDPITKKDLAFEGYGQLLFLPFKKK